MFTNRDSVPPQGGVSSAHAFQFVPAQRAARNAAASAAFIAALAIAPASLAQVTSYIGQQLTNPTGTLTFTWPGPSGSLINFQEAGLYVTSNGAGSGQGCTGGPHGGGCCVPYGFSHGGWYYPAGATQLVRIRRVDGGGLQTVEFQAGDPWNGCLGNGDGLTHMWVLAYGGGLILTSLDIDVPTGTYVGFTGVFDELRVGAYVNAYARNLHDQGQVNGASFDNMRYLNSSCPGATTPPVDQRSCTDGTFSFSVGAGGQAPLGYQWQWLPSDAGPDGWITIADGANNYQGHPVFTASGSQTATLTRTGNGGIGSSTSYSNYRCVVSNASCSVATYGALLGITPPPTIQTQPQNSSACSYTWATVTVEPAVAINNPGPFTYQWQIRVPQENWRTIHDGDVDSDAFGLLGTAAYTTQQTLYWYPQVGDPPLQFRVIVSNGCGTITSSSATFAVCNRVGDLNCDGQVDLNDLATLLSDYGCSNSFCPGDLNGDNQTDLADLALMLSSFGSTCP